MDEPIDAAGLRARQERSRARVEQAQARAMQARAALTAQTSTASSADRAATVTVGPAGTLLDVSFAPTAGKLAPPTLARSVLDAYRRATAESVGRTEQVLRELVGPDDPSLALVRASLTPHEEEQP